MSKRARTVNFSAEEINLLVDLVLKYKHILENRRTDAVMWQDKEKAWKALENDFNSSSGATYRSAQHLKIKYEALKHDTRKKSAQLRTSSITTGGGPSSAPMLTIAENKIKSMILLSVQGLESTFDSDFDNSIEVDQNKLGDEEKEHILFAGRGSENTLSEVEHKICSPEESSSLQTEYVTVIVPEEDTYASHESKDCQRVENLAKVTTPDSNKWQKWTPKQIKQKKHPALCNSRPSSSRKRPFELLAEKKIESVEQQMDVVSSEYMHMEQIRIKAQKLEDLKLEEQNLKIELLNIEKKT